MLNELKMQLDNGLVNYRQTSRLQGVLMEQISAAYAQQLHEQGLKPYSQALVHEDNKVFWIVRTLNQAAYENIVIPMKCREFDSFQMENDLGTIHIIGKEERSSSLKELMNHFYTGLEDQKFINLSFQTPVSFKSGNRYLIYPELKNIYLSLMNKYSAISESEDMMDQETLDQLVAGSELVRYNLRSTFFPLEGIRIPSFVGNIGIKIHGSHTMASYVRMLCEFGEYSGVGIKTAMGMGCMKIEKRRSENDRSGN